MLQIKTCNQCLGIYSKSTERERDRERAREEREKERKEGGRRERENICAKLIRFNIIVFLVLYLAIRIVGELQRSRLSIKEISLG